MRGRHVGDVGLRHHDVGTHHAADKSREQDEGQGLADGGHDHHDRKAENARKQHGTPSDAVRKGAEDGREEELHQAVAHHDCAVPAGLQVARVSERSDEPRKNRNNEPDAQCVEEDAGKNKPNCRLSHHGTGARKEADEDPILPRVAGRRGRGRRAAAGRRGRAEPRRNPPSRFDANQQL